MVTTRLDAMEQLRDEFMKEINRVWEHTELEKGYVIVTARKEPSLEGVAKVKTMYRIVDKLPKVPLSNTMCFEFDKEKGITPVWVLPNTDVDVPFEVTGDSKPNSLIYNEKTWSWYKYL